MVEESRNYSGGTSLCYERFSDFCEVRGKNGLCEEEAKIRKICSPLLQQLSLNLRAWPMVKCHVESLE